MKTERAAGANGVNFASDGKTYQVVVNGHCTPWLPMKPYYETAKRAVVEAT